MVTLKKSLLISILLFLLVSWWHIYLPNIPNPNERIRFFLAHSLATRGEFSVNKEIAHYGGSIDRSRVGENIYCDKAPLLSFLGVPSMVILTQIQGEWPTEKKALRWLKLSTVYPFAILLFWLVFIIVFNHTKHRNLAFLAAGSTLFATPIFTWFQLYFSHSVVATMVLLFYHLNLKMRTKEMSLFFYIFTGIVGGVAFWTEYTVAPPLFIISAISLFVMKKQFNYLWFLAGGITIGLLFMLHNQSLFGGPLSLGYSHLADKGFAAGQSKGLFGITTPTWHAITQTLFSFRIGILTLSPFLIFSIASLFDTTNRRKIIEWWILFIAHFLLVTSFAFWGGGGSFGSRHMVAVLPFLLLLSVHGLAVMMKINRAFLTVYLALAAFSTAIFMTVSTIFPFFVGKFSNPMANFFLPAVREGFFPNDSLLSGLVSNQTTAFAFWIVIVLLFIAVSLYLLSGKSLFHSVIAFSIAFSLYLLSFAPYATKKDALWDCYMTMERVEKKSEWTEKKNIIKEKM